MDKLIKVLGIVGQGFLFGLCFCVAAWGAYFVFQGASVTAATSQTIARESDFLPGPTRTAKNFEFRDVEEIKQDGRTFFTGVIKNIGRSSSSGINIEVNLFKKAKFVDQYSTYLSGTIAAGEERYFKVSCGCKDNPPAEHDSYKIAALGGY